MKVKIGFLIAATLLVSGCASSETAKNWSDLNQATNYPMQNCPTSELAISNTNSDLPDIPLPCLGHETSVNLAGLPTGKPLVVSLWASWCVYCEDDALAFIAAKNKFKKP